MSTLPPPSTDSLRFALYTRFLKGEAKIPQMPENALRIRRLLDDPRTSLEQLSRVINSDPPLAAYLLQFAESPMLRGARPCNSLRDVLGRLGTEKLYQLVLGFSMRNLFISKELPLQKVFRARWRASLERAAYCACLAARSPVASVDDALLAGLLQDIGSLPLLAELERWPDFPRDENALRALCEELSGPVGVVILTAWKQPPAMIDVARQRREWHRDQAFADLADLVQVASLLQALPPADAPPLRDAPALRRLFPVVGESVEASDSLLQQIAEEAPLWFKLLGAKPPAKTPPAA
ncbi:HDOD domain-containing protein [Pseudomonas mangiferae]|uniref:HDOD domain-containing protein n=1 Tax=Pseudomonas mangiferae TaxID=2593654 RepID=A0A553H2C2_9PSED|nr:HDOD domain-containing protein [Pseudomonas mangiferae]TRX75900.1 HDOD domain-containing protein [Pseudomonas mangiferae]